MQIRQITSKTTKRVRKRDVLFRSDFTLDNIKLLSNDGRSSTVYSCTYQGKVVALKVSNDDDTLYQLKHERLLFESFSFRKDKAYGAECIINYLGHITTLPGGMQQSGLYFPGYRFTLVTEFANHGSLEKFIMGDPIKNMLPAKLTALQTRTIVTDIAKGISALHDYKIVHCDIKLANMLLTQDDQQTLHVKIADLGLSKFAHEVKNSRCSPLYAAPEVLKEERQDEKSDIYSMGFALWEVIEGKSVKTGLVVETLNDLAEAVVKNNKRPPIYDTFPIVLGQWMKHCWKASPNERPSAGACAVAFSALTDVDIENTYEKQQAWKKNNI